MGSEDCFVPKAVCVSPRSSAASPVSGAPPPDSAMYRPPPASAMPRSAASSSRVTTGRPSPSMRTRGRPVLESTSRTGAPCAVPAPAAYTRMPALCASATAPATPAPRSSPSDTISIAFVAA